MLFDDFGVYDMNEIENATENENWLLNLIDAGQHQNKLIEQRMQVLEASNQQLQEALNQLLQKLGV